MKDIYNYTSVWRSPYKIYNFKNYKLSRNGIKLSTIILCGILYLIFYVLNVRLHITEYVGKIYYALPFLITYYLVTRNVDGKNILTFFYDYIYWKYTIYKKRNILSYDKEVLYTDRKNKFL